MKTKRTKIAFNLSQISSLRFSAAAIFTAVVMRWKEIYESYAVSFTLAKMPSNERSWSQSNEKSERKRATKLKTNWKFMDEKKFFLLFLLWSAHVSTLLDFSVNTLSRLQHCLFAALQIKKKTLQSREKKSERQQTFMKGAADVVCFLSCSLYERHKTIIKYEEK